MPPVIVKFVRAMVVCGPCVRIQFSPSLPTVIETLESEIVLLPGNNKSISFNPLSPAVHLTLDKEITELPCPVKMPLNALSPPVRCGEETG